MRITNSMITRNYTSSLTNNLSRLNMLNAKVVSQRSFNRMSENVSSGVRALQVRRSMAQTEDYISTVKSIKSTMTAAESNLMQLSQTSRDISAKFSQGINGTQGPQEREILASELEKMQDSVLNLLNGKFGDGYMFGGTNDVSAPFSTNEAGKLTYNGEVVSELDKNNPLHAKLFEDAAFADIGMGMNFGDMSSGTAALSTQSVFQHTIRGIDITGTGDPNYFDTITDMIGCLRDGVPSKEEAGNLLDTFNQMASNANLQLTKMGADTNYLDFALNRLTGDLDNLKEKQNLLETNEPAAAIMEFKMQEYVYNAALQMGSRILQPSLFDYIK